MRKIIIPGITILVIVAIVVILWSKTSKQTAPAPEIQSTVEATLNNTEILNIDNISNTTPESSPEEDLVLLDKDIQNI